MTALPPSPPTCRSPRVQFAHTMPAVLRFSNGQSGHAEIRVLSLTGGLLTLPRCVHHGARVKLMFLLETGAILSPIEMLRPVNWTQQPFRFLELEPRDQHRLQNTIQSALGTPVTPAASPARFHLPKPVTVPPAVKPAGTITSTRPIEATPTASALDDAWITRYRERVDQRNASRKRTLAAILGAIGLSIICLCSAVYVYTYHWK